MHILFTILLFFSLNSGLDSIRYKYHSISDEASLDSFIEELKSNEGVSTVYLASAYMQKAQYVLSPLKKLNYFNKGKDMLEEFILKHPDNIDARYVRFLVQTNSPSFLGYKSEIKIDKKFVQDNIKSAGFKEDMADLMLKVLNDN
nr:hypothetical protein [uncultured Carboxylicivirga sp.]